MIIEYSLRAVQEEMEVKRERCGGEILLCVVVIGVSGGVSEVL